MRTNNRMTTQFHSNCYPIESEYRLRKYLFSGKAELVEKASDEFFNELVKYTQEDTRLLKSWFVQAVIILYHKAWQIGVPLGVVLSDIDTMLFKINTIEDTALNSRHEELERLKLLFKEIVKDLLNEVIRQMNSDHIIDKAKRYIQAHFHRKLNLKEVSEALHVEQELLQELLDRELGSSFHDYLLKTRIDEAKKMLTTTNFSVSEIAVQVGFRDASYFIRTFKRMEGVTPGKYIGEKEVHKVIVPFKQRAREKASSESSHSLKGLIQKERDAWMTLLSGDLKNEMAVCDFLLKDLYDEYQSLRLLQAYCLKLITVFSRKGIQIGIRTEDILNSILSLNYELSVLNSPGNVNVYMNQLIKNMLERVTIHHNETAFRAIETVKNYIKHNYYRPLQINDLARLVNFSPYHLTRLFIKFTGVTMYNYVTQTRMEEAKRLITTTDYSIEEIAAKVGYQDGSHFMTIFKKKVGQTPRRFSDLTEYLSR